ncbi:MAG: FtsX-like permease family protein, partial [Desulfobacterales bacterium]|nr:FtsX-like permease family protein [Desulfobacterales bacterium]
ESNKPEYIVKSWKESAEGVIAMTKVGDIENQIIISLILIMAAIGIINVIILSAIERLKETGMMKAMGMKESEIIFVYMMESVWIGLIGGFLGVLLGAISVAYFVNYGIDMTMFGIMDMNYGIPIVNVIYGSWNPGAFIFVFFFGGIVALFSSILPARWAARKDPIDAIYQR